MKTLLIVYHSRTNTSRSSAIAAAEGANLVKKNLKVDNNILLKEASEITLNDFLIADTYLFCAPENLASLSGAMKECLDTYYYDLLNKIEGRHFSALISAGTDGSNALRQLRTICTGWRLKEAVPAQIILTKVDTKEEIQKQKTLTPEQETLAWETGATLFAMM